MVKKLISGGQTGADISIVPVGEELGLPIGGIVPKGWMTEAGPDPSLATHGFVEAASIDYAFRTRRNIEGSDATLIFVTDPESDGTRLTIDYAASIGKPYLLVDPFEREGVDKVRQWLNETRPAVLNVAGNRESRSSGLSRAASGVLREALS